MKRNNIDRYAERHNSIGRLILVLCLLSFYLCPIYAQNDSALNRSVTVERDFQPVIQAAGKVSTKPAVVETTIEPAPVEYSDYTAEVTPSSAFHPLLSQPTRFAAAQPFHGYIRAGLGHPNTLFDFGYRHDDGKNSVLDIYAHHKAAWGLATLSKSKVGMNFTHTFSTCNLYFGVNGGNIYYHKYGHFYDYAGSSAADGVTRSFGLWTKNDMAYPAPHTITDMDKTSLWTAEVIVGIKANAKQDVQYKVQTGYNLFSKPGAVTEHQVRTHASFDWHSEAHHVGAKAYVQNNFLQLGSLSQAIDDSLYNSRHNIRFEPYYAYEGNRIRLHVGVNLDMNIGRGQNSLSGINNLTFAPSPHINLEAQIAKQWLTLYADVTGSHGLGSLESYMESNRYRLIHPGVVSHHAASYTPVDAELGFHIRPHSDLLLEIHGGYALQYDNMTLIANTEQGSTIYPLKNGNTVAMMSGDFAYTYSDYGCGKIGGQLNYHYRDIVRINLHGDYYFWNAFEHEKVGYLFAYPCEEINAVNAGTNTTVYDRANWQLGLRIDGRIDKHWSLYSDNRFKGSRLALASDGEHILKPTIDLDLGVEYHMWVGKAKSKANADAHILRPETKPNLTFFLQINNWLHRKNELYYGYRSQGINGLIGVSYKF